MPIEDSLKEAVEVTHLMNKNVFSSLLEIVLGFDRSGSVLHRLDDCKPSVSKNMRHVHCLIIKARVC